ncbi:MAG: JAB domain-containing protein [Bacteroidota bacterium]|nr:JAB domain-containing protein [Bacteroidota bacterium]
MPKTRTLNTLNEIRVTYSNKTKSCDRIKIGSSRDVASLFRSVWSDNIEFREEFNILLLNRANHVLGWYQVSKGGCAGTVVDPKLIFAVALKCNAQGVILCHNHPSGNLTPSESDLKLTEKLKKGGNLLDIAILDHIILSVESYYSFADEANL